MRHEICFDAKLFSFLVIFIGTEKGFYCLLLMHSSYQNGPQDSLNLFYSVS